MGLENILGLSELNSTNSSIWEILPPETLSRVESLITLLEITGIVIMGYIIFLLIKWVYNIKRHRKINKIYDKVNEMDQKLNLLISKKKKEKRNENVIEKKGKKKEGWINNLFKKKSELNTNKIKKKQNRK